MAAVAAAVAAATAAGPADAAAAVVVAAQDPASQVATLIAFTRGPVAIKHSSAVVESASVCEPVLVHVMTLVRSWPSSPTSTINPSRILGHDYIIAS